MDTNPYQSPEGRTSATSQKNWWKRICLSGLGLYVAIQVAQGVFLLTWYYVTGEMASPLVKSRIILVSVLPVLGCWAAIAVGGIGWLVTRLRRRG